MKSFKDYLTEVDDKLRSKVDPDFEKAIDQMLGKVVAGYGGPGEKKEIQILDVQKVIDYLRNVIIKEIKNSED